jgi:cytochrome c peroxidase
LFYEKNLSENHTISCSSCHNPAFYVSDTARLSKGFVGGFTERNCMSLLNTRFFASGKIFWDERADSIEAQVPVAIHNATEMDMTLPALEARIDSQSYYPPLFLKAFGTAEVTSDKISRVLSQFVRSIVTYRSKYDRVKEGLATFTPSEKQGETTFLTASFTPCAGCHVQPMFMSCNPVKGFGLLDPNDLGINGTNRFKTVGLRNMTNAINLCHNGSVSNVSTVLNSNIPDHGVNPKDVTSLLAFLQTLTDNIISTDV